MKLYVKITAWLIAASWAITMLSGCGGMGE